MSNDNLNEIKSQLKSLSEAELHGIISGALLEIKTRAYHEGVEFGSGMADLIDNHRETLTNLANRKSDQEIRDEIVIKAKRDVTRLIDGLIFGKMFYVNFVVNREKRTTVALIRYAHKSGIHKRGIAKCDPTDCFNSHIGEAISLRRALGLEVPTEYLTAPAPTEVRVGDVIQSLMSGTIGTKVDSKEGEHTLINNGIYYTLAHSVCNVIDDSREQGGEE
jgi:hypothetical protein